MAEAGAGEGYPPANAPLPAGMVRREAAPAVSGASDPAAWANTPRNAPCPCGSGQKYKHCHGKVA